MPAALDVDWDAIRFHLCAHGGDYALTAEAFGVDHWAIRKRAERGEWLKILKDDKKASKECLSKAVQKTSESLLNLSTSFRFHAMKKAVKAMKGVEAEDITPKSATEYAALVNGVAKVAGWASEQQTTAVQVLFTGSEAHREVHAPAPEPDAIDVDSETIDAE